MKYIKITNTNANALLCKGATAVHSKHKFTENELEELEYDSEIEIINASAGTISVRFLGWKNPDSKTLPPTVYNESIFSDGYWWIKK